MIMVLAEVEYGSKMQANTITFKAKVETEILLAPNISEWIWKRETKATTQTNTSWK